jgi:hypothetical protein
LDFSPAIIITALILALLSLWYGGAVRKGVADASAIETISEYKIAPWVYVVIVLSMIFSLAMIIIGVPSVPSNGGKSALLIIEGSWFLMSIFLIFSSAKSSVIIDDEKITIRPGKGKSILYKNIKSASIISFYIVMDEGKVPGQTHLNARMVKFVIY